MSNIKIKDRIENYSEISSIKLMAKLPVITVINGRSFAKLSNLLEKPFSKSLAECFYSTLIALVQEMEGAVFGYTFNDEIIIVSRNDQSLETQPWCDNDIQKISSVVASIATLHFNNYAASLDLNFMGDPLFYAQTFAVPNIMEAINVLVSKQQQAFQTSIQFSCFYELLKKYDRNDIKDMLNGATIDEKINLLQQECGIDFNQYPLAFRRGVACYKAPKVVIFENEEIVKRKWILNSELPIFTKEHSFLNSVFKHGTDILRKN